MKKLLLLVAAVLSFTAMQAQDKFSEDFESGTFPPTGWTAYQASTKSYWTTATYATEANFKNKVITGYNDGGTKCAKVISGGLNAIGKVNPSSWLITPSISVSNGENLRFYLGHNCGFNASAQVTDDSKRTKLEVLVSETTADTLEFKEKIYEVIPIGVKNWSEVSIDLSKYAGKDIYIAFHEYGTPQATPFIMNNLYIDDVKVSDKATSDLWITKAPEFKNGTIASQPLTMTVKNSGAALTGFKAGYSVDGGTPVVESFSQAIGFGEEATVTFGREVAIAADGQAHAVKVWCDGGDADANHANDSTSVSVTVAETAQIPYVMGADAATDFVSSYRRVSGMNVFGWDYMSKFPAWVYTSTTAPSYLYSSKGYALKKGKLKFKFNITSTADNAKLHVILTKVTGEYENEVGVAELKTTVSAVDQSLYVDVPEDGNYIIALKGETTGQIAIFGMKISEPYEDMIAESFVSPTVTSMLVQEGVSVTVRYKNDGVSTLKNVPVYYKVGEGAVKAGTIASIDAEATVDYTFADKADLLTEGATTIKAWVAAEGDGDVTNDTITTVVNVYNAKAFPYSTSFETDEDAALWTSINVDGDDTYWGIEEVGSQKAIAGTKAMFINYMTSSEHNDFAVSPALNLTKDMKARVAFYYAPLTTYGGSRLKAYLTKTLDPAKILSEGKELLDISLDTKGYNYASAPVTVDETGVYYVAIYSCGGKDEVLVDNFTIDAASELALVGMTSSEAGSTYDNVKPNITVTIKNCGVNSIKGGKLAYTILVKDGTNYVAQSTVEETYTDEIAPNTSLDYTFKTAADLAGAGSYRFMAALTSTEDADATNNNYACEGPTIYQTKEIPYVMGFEDADDRSALMMEGGWKAGTGSTPYEGTALIQHSGKASEDGDWIYLNRVALEAGTYDFSFFWKTMTNNTADTQRQSFEVFIGNEATPAAMTTSLYKGENVLNADHKATKVLVPLTIAADGNYFIGIKCTTTNTLGSLSMDYFVIDEPVAGAELVAGTKYQADFKNAEGEWYHYYPTRTSSQWTAKDAGDGTAYMTVARTYMSYSGLWTTPGIYESPAFKFAKGDKVNVKFAYSMAAGTGVTLDGESKMNMYMADKDLPEAFTTLVAEGAESAEKNEATGAITVPEDGVYYFGFLPSSNVSTNFNLYSCEIELDVASAVDDIEENTTIVYTGKDLVLPSEYEQAQLVKVDGTVVAVFRGISKVNIDAYASGLYIVRVKTANGIITKKIIIG